MADERLARKDTDRTKDKRIEVEITEVVQGSPALINRYLTTSSVLQVTDLIARLVIQNPRDTPAITKSRMLFKGLKQGPWGRESWSPSKLIDVFLFTSATEYILQFPITNESEIFQQMDSFSGAANQPPSKRPHHEDSNPDSSSDKRHKLKS
ncbi:hypothetical protein H0H93_002850 [Arthromyces matolae]|nr:hypothetical protein H0H93_002850 [Arthromyces matolae]